MDEVDPLSVDKYIGKFTPKPKKARYVCVINKEGQRVCYKNDHVNEIMCNDSRCRVNYKTINHEILGKTLPSGIWTNLYENGYLSQVQLIGVIPKKNLPSIQRILPSVPIKETNVINDPFFGVPKKPLKCHLMPFRKECKNLGF